MKWFLNLGTQSKLILGCAVFLLLLVVVAVSGYLELRQVVRSQTSMVENEVASALALRDVRANQNGMREDALVVSIATDAATIEPRLRDMETRSELIRRSMSLILSRLSTTPEIKDKLEQFERIRQDYEKTRVQEAMPAIRGGRRAAAQGLILGIQSERNRELQKLADEVVTLTEAQLKAAVARSQDLAARTATMFLVVGVVAVLFAIFIVAALNRAISFPLIGISRAAERVAARDLTVKIETPDRRDEVGFLAASFKSVIDNWHTLAQEIREGVGVVGAAATEIVAGTSQLASSAAETATAISQTSATLEQVKQTALASAQKAKSVFDNAQKTAQVSESGRKAVEDTIEVMNRIREQMAKIADGVVRLSEQGQAIGEIIASVNDLAEQSNLLAVNAAIEAAKAGEYGRGFGVVAQEVKSLAEQSKQATAHVRTILGDIQKATSAAVMATDQGNKAVEAGMKQVTEASASIRLMAQSISQSAQAASQILASAQQQSAGMEQVALAAENIRQASAQNVSSTRQAEVAARNLHDLGHKLQVLVQQYQL